MQFRLPQDLSLGGDECKRVVHRVQRFVRTPRPQLCIRQHAEQEWPHQARPEALPGLHALPDFHAARFPFAFGGLDPAIQRDGHREPLGVTLLASDRDQTIERVPCD